MFFQNLLMRKFYPGSIRVTDLLRSVTLIIVCFISLAAKAATITATASGGHWGVGATWVGGVVPSPSDMAVIPAGSTVVFSESDGTAGAAGRINFNNPGTIQVHGILNLQTSADDPIFQNVVTIDVFSGGQMQDNTGFGEMYLQEGSHLYVYSGGSYYTPFNTNFGDAADPTNVYFLVVPSPTVNGPFTLDITSAAVTYNPGTNPPPAAGSAPTAVTGGASALTVNSATVAGTVNDNGAATTVTFRYGTDPGLVGAASVTATPSPIAPGTGNTAVSANLTGLSSSTQYYYQVVAANGVATTSGPIQGFLTPAPPDIAPVVTTTSGTTNYSAIGAGSGAVVVDPGVTVSDADNTTLSTGVVTISAGFQPGDVLSVTSSANITGFYDPTSHSLLLTGISATLAQWNTVLQSMTFANTSSGAVSGNRTISFMVNDGTLNSVAATKTVDVVHGLAYAGGLSQSASFCENSGGQDLNSLLAVSDLATGQTLTYSVIGAASHGSLSGFAPGTFSSNGGTLTPTGLTYTPTAGYTGTDLFSIQVTNGVQTTTTVINVTVNAQPSVNPVTGSAPVCAGSAITLSSGPAGGIWSSDNTSVATVDASGVVNGQAQGAANISYTITNGSGCSKSASVLVVVNPVPATPGAMTGSASVQNTQTGVTYSVTNDPNVSYVWSYTPAGGVTINGTGNAVTLDFDPTATSGTLSVRPFSVCGVAGTPSALSVAVSAPVITVSPASLAVATVGIAYNSGVVASGGTGPYVFAVTSGVLPDGLTLAGDGTLSGIPTAGGSFPITITATDGSAGHYTGSQLYTLTVGAPTISLAPTSLSNGSYAQVYTGAMLSATGGTGPYSFAVTSGTLPPGLSLASNGSLSGTPTLAGDYNFTVTATDASTGAGPYTGAISYTVNIAPVTLTVTAGDQSMTYGGAVPRLSVTYSGFVNGDDVSSLTIAPSLTTTATAASVAGTYAINASGAISGKYSFTYVAGVLTVNPASVSVTAKAQTKVYGNPDPNPDYTFTGLVNGDGAGIFTGGLSRDRGENVGTYPITQGTLSAGGNYTLHFTGSLLTITRATQQISWTQQLLSGCDDTKQLQLTGNSNSGLPLIYTSSDANVATVSGDVLTLVGPGSATITATQPGDDNHLAAAPLDNMVVNQSSSLVRQHWEDALFFDNTGNDYVQWQWYKNGSAVSGATSPYYSETPTLSGQYYVIATDKDGHKVQTCPLNVTGNGAVTGGIKVVPNPASAGQAVSVTCNYTATALQGARLQVLNISGIVVQTLTNVQPSMQVNMPTTRGIYVLSLVLSNGQKASVNVLVN
jgi:hypothetical protein